MPALPAPVAQAQVNEVEGLIRPSPVRSPLRLQKFAQKYSVFCLLIIFNLTSGVIYGIYFTMDTFFAITTPLGYTIRTTKKYWQYLIEVKHPFMADKEGVVKEVLKNPGKVCQSILDDTAYLYYRNMERLYCAVAKHTPSSKEGFLITAYPTSKIKEGELIWTK